MLSQVMKTAHMYNLPIFAQLCHSLLSAKVSLYKVLSSYETLKQHGDKLKCNQSSYNK